MYEYKFVRLNLGWLSGEPKRDYRQVVHDHAREGWRLFQIFTPGVGGFGQVEYFKLIFERPVQNAPEPVSA